MSERIEHPEPRLAQAKSVERRTFIWYVHRPNDEAIAVKASGLVVTDSGDLLFYSSGRVPIKGWAAGEWLSFVKQPDAA